MGKSEIPEGECALIVCRTIAFATRLSTVLDTGCCGAGLPYSLNCRCTLEVISAEAAVVLAAPRSVARTPAAVLSSVPRVPNSETTTGA